MSWELVVKEKFSAAHYLEHYQGKCEHMHGHTFQVEVTLIGNSLDRSGISFDFTRVRNRLREILPDHCLLNDRVPGPPSAENLARHFYQLLKDEFPIQSVMVWESENAGARYREDR